jgi:hypothetical protein
MFFATLFLFDRSFPDIHLSRDVPHENGMDLVSTKVTGNQLVEFPINGRANSGLTLDSPVASHLSFG